MKRIYIVLVFISVLLPFNSNAENNLLIKSGTIIDGISNKPFVADIEIIDGKINQIGKNLKSSIQKVVDAKGLFIMPGLIDGHTHLNSIPGDVFRNSTHEEKEAQFDFQLKAYLAAGVTTLLDAAAPKSLLPKLKKRFRPNAIPRVKILAPFLTPKNGYFAGEHARGESYKDLWEPVDSPEMIKKHFEDEILNESTGVKVTFEEGFGPFSVWPTFKSNQLGTIKKEAAQKNLPIFVHSISESEYKKAIKFRPYAFVHAGFNEKVASDKILDEIKETNAYVVTTLAVLKMALFMWDHDALNDPWLKRLVPKEQLETAMDKKVRSKAIKIIVRGSAPKWIPTWLVRPFSGLFFNKSILKKSLKKSMLTVEKMYKKGIPLVMGADEGNWPVWTSLFHGVGSVIEMETMQEAGLDNSEIIKAATSRAAKMLKIQDEVGSIEKGKVADLILLEQNPLENMSALRTLKYTVRAGTAKTPDEWLDVRKN